MTKTKRIQPFRGGGDGLVQGQHTSQFFHGQETLQPAPRTNELAGRHGLGNRQALLFGPFQMRVLL